MERAVFAPEVLATALAIPGGSCARALERVIDGEAELMMSPLVSKATLARLVTLFDFDAEALGRTALLLADLGSGPNVASGGESGADRTPARSSELPDRDAVNGELSMLCSMYHADSLVVTSWMPDVPRTYAITRVVLARRFAGRAVVRERRKSGLSLALERLEAIARALDPLHRERLPPVTGGSEDRDR